MSGRWADEMSTEEHEPLDAKPAEASAGISRRTSAIAIVAAALVAGGAAFAVTKIHAGSTSAAAAAPVRGAGAPSFRNDGGRFDGGRGGFGRGFGRGGGLGLSAAATYLGLSTPELFSDLQSGKTLASIASATPGKSAQGLVAAMLASEKSTLQAAVSAGRLSQSQADVMTAALSAQITALVNGGFGGGRGFGFPRGPNGPGGPSGQGGGGASPPTPSGAI